MAQWSFAQTTVVNFPSAFNDAMVVSGTNAQTNFGSQGALEVFHKLNGSGNNASSIASRSYIQYDISNIPSDAIIVSAKLKLKPIQVSNNADHSIFIERVARNATWKEGTITWNNQPEVVTTDRLAFTNNETSNTNLQEFEVTNHIQQMVYNSGYNNGWRISLQNETGTTNYGMAYSSSDVSQANKRPELTVEYILPIQLTSSVTHCTAGSNDGSFSIAVSGGSGIPQNRLYLYKVVHDVNQVGFASLLNVASAHNLLYNSTSRVITADNLESGIYMIRVMDQVYNSDGDNKYSFYKYILVGREGETTSGLLLPHYNYQENTTIARDKPTKANPTDMANTIFFTPYQSIALRVADAVDNYEYASLVKYQLDFDDQLEFSKAELKMRAWSKFFRHHQSSNAVNLSLATSSWEEESVTWNTRPSVINKHQIQIPATTTIGYEQNHTWDAVDIGPFVAYWQENPAQNYGFEIALANYNFTQYAQRSYKSHQENNHFVYFEFTVKAGDNTTYDDEKKKGTLTVTAPSGSTGPYKYLLSYEPLPDLTTLWNGIKDEVPITQASFFQGDEQSSTFTFTDLDAERYYVGIYDNNGNKISDQDAVVGPEIRLVNASNVEYRDGSVSFAGNGQTGVASIEGLLDVDQNGGIEFEIEEPGDFVLGFNKAMDQMPSSTTEFDLGVEFLTSNSQIRVFAEGNQLFTDTYRVGDKLRLEKREGRLYCYFKGFEIAKYDIPLTASGQYRTDIFYKGVVGKTTKLTKYDDYVEFFIPYRVQEIHAKDCDNPMGGVSILPAFGISGSGTYSIVNLETGSGISGTLGEGSPGFSIPLPAGEYSITFTWDGGAPSTYTRYFNIGVPVDWNISNAYFEEVDGTVNTITTDGSANVGKAFSKNTLLSSEEGWASFNVKLKKYYPPWGAPSLFAGAINAKVGLGSAPVSIYAKVNVHSVGPDIINKYVWVSDVSNSVVSTPFITWRDGPFKIKLETGNFKVSFNNSASSIATIAAPIDVSAYKLYASGLSSTIYDSYASFCLAIPDQYVTPKREIEGGYFLVPKDHLLRFEFAEEYTLGNELKYTVKDFQGATVLDSDAQVIAEVFGDNRLQLDVSTLIAEQYYVMEILNDKGENWFIRFKKQ